MSTLVIDKKQSEASVIYDAFLTSMALPAIYAQDSVDLVIEEIELQIERSGANTEPAELTLMQAYLSYLKQTN